MEVLRTNDTGSNAISKDANSDILKQSLLNIIYSSPGGIPMYLYIDSGRDCTAKMMTRRPQDAMGG